MSGRIRTIKPEVLEDEIAASLSDAAWRLWVSLWVLADDHGNARAGDRGLAASVWQDTSLDVDAPRAELAAKGLVTLYAVRGQRYLHINGWEKNQRIDNAGKARVPGQNEDDGSWNQGLSAVFADSSANFGESRTVKESPREIPLRAIQRPDHDPDPRPATPTTEPASSAGANVRKRASRIPENWQPSEGLAAWCQEQGVDGAAHVAEFVDHWRGTPGQKGTKLDWDATFRNRIRTLIDQGRAKPWVPADSSSKREPGEEPASEEEASKYLQQIKSSLSGVLRP